MIASTNISRRIRELPRDAAVHLFSIGQAVRLKSGFVKPALPEDIYLVTAMLPPRGDALQYRIRNESERHERVTTQDNLEPVDMTQSEVSETPIERTVSHGQGSDEKQSRSKKAKAGKGQAEA